MEVGEVAGEDAVGVVVGRGVGVDVEDPIVNRVCSVVIEAKLESSCVPARKHDSEFRNRNELSAVAF